MTRSHDTERKTPRYGYEAVVEDNGRGSNHQSEDVEDANKPSHRRVEPGVDVDGRDPPAPDLSAYATQATLRPEQVVVRGQDVQALGAEDGVRTANLRTDCC